MKKTVIRQYARLIARTGINIQKDQPVVITAQADQFDFVRVLTEECYRAGAGEVVVDWEYQPLTKLNVRWQKQRTLGAVPSWEEKRWRFRAGTLPAMIYIESEDPDGLDGMDQAKWAKARQSRYKVIKPIRDDMEGKYQWCIAAVPGEKWARKVFPELSKSKAVEKLWEAILYTPRQRRRRSQLAEHDAISRRAVSISTRSRLPLSSISPQRTDLRVGLIPTRSSSAAPRPRSAPAWSQPNIPSEECFISPRAGMPRIVYSSARSATAA